MRRALATLLLGLLVGAGLTMIFKSWTSLQQTQFLSGLGLGFIFGVIAFAAIALSVDGGRS